MGNRLIVVSMSAFFGGGEEFLKRLITCLDNDCNITLICSSTLLQKKLQSANVKVELVKGNMFSRYIKTFFKIVRLPGTMRSTLLLNGQGAGYLGPFVRPLLKKLVWVQHTSVKYSNSALKLSVVLFCLKRVDTVVCVSQSLHNEIVQFIRKDNVKVIHNWLPATAVRTLTYNPLEGKLKLLFISRLVEEKGILPLVEIVMQDVTMELIVVGDGPLFSTIQSKYAHSPTIRLMGWQHDIMPFIREAHLNIVNSYSEGFSYTPIEAGVCGVPSLISDIEVHKEISENGKYAFLFAAGSSEDLRNKLVYLKNNRNELAIMSSFCKDRFIKKFVHSNYKEAYKKELL